MAEPNLHTAQGSPRTTARIALAAAYGFAGYKHLTAPDALIAITPAWVPFPEHVVLATGWAEIAGAIGLLIPKLRKAAGIGLVLHALCVWPANFNHWWNDIAFGDTRLPDWYHAVRLPLQIPIIWWTLWASELIEWPFGRSSGSGRQRTKVDAKALHRLPKCYCPIESARITFTLTERRFGPPDIESSADAISSDFPRDDHALPCARRMRGRKSGW